MSGFSIFGMSLFESIVVFQLTMIWISMMSIGFGLEKTRKFVFEMWLRVVHNMDP